MPFTFTFTYFSLLRTHSSFGCPSMTGSPYNVDASMVINPSAATTIAKIRVKPTGKYPLDWGPLDFGGSGMWIDYNIAGGTISTGGDLSASIPCYDTLNRLIGSAWLSSAVCDLIGNIAASGSATISNVQGGSVNAGQGSVSTASSATINVELALNLQWGSQYSFTTTLSAPCGPWYCWLCNWCPYHSWVTTIPADASVQLKVTARIRFQTTTTGKSAIFVDASVSGKACILWTCLDPGTLLIIPLIGMRDPSYSDGIYSSSAPDSFTGPMMKVWGDELYP